MDPLQNSEGAETWSENRCILKLVPCLLLEHGWTFDNTKQLLSFFMYDNILKIFILKIVI